MSEFADLGAEEKRYVLEGALPRILADLTHPAPTHVVAARIARALGADPKEVAGPLVKLAHSYPAATRTGAVKKRFGKAVQGFLWHPAKSSSVGLEDIL